MPIDREKHARLKRQLVEVDGALEAAQAEVRYLRHGTVAADGTRMLERSPIDSTRMRLSRESPFNLAPSQLAELRQMVADAELHFRDIDPRRMTISQGDMLADLRTAQQLVALYTRLAEAEAHVADIVARRAPLATLVQRLDEYVGSRETRGLVQSLGVTHVA
jgi:phosphoenolpyruvate carboxylase